MHQHTRIFTILFCIAIIAYSHIGYSDEDVWAKLKRGGHVVLMRHATTGGGDGIAFEVNDCSVQRNLSPFGREEAEIIGQVFRARSIPIAKVISSRYCRCEETAELAFGRVTTWQPLDTLSAVPGKDRRARTEVVAKRIGAYAGSGNLIMVTHRRNILWLTHENIEPGGFLVLKPDRKGGFDIVEYLIPDELETN